MQNEVHEAVDKGDAAEGDCCAQIVAALTSITDQLKAQNDRQQSADRRKNWVDNLTLLLVIVTAGFTGLSWVEFKKAYGPAESSAAAATRAANAAERALDGLERPILMLKSMTGNLVSPKAAGGGLKFDVVPEVINVGRVAASIKSTCFSIYKDGVLPDPVPEALKNMSCADKGLAPAERILDAKEVFAFPFESAWASSPEDTLRFIKGQKPIYVVGQVDYEDLFGVLRQRGFGRRYVLPGDYFAEAGGASYNYDRKK
jgi:hypothetical protein